MTPLAIQRLLELLDAEQEDTAANDPVALPADLLELAQQGGTPTAEQIQALLASPGLRQLMRLALYRRQASFAIEPPANEGNVELFSLRLAAAGQEAPELPWVQDIRVGEGGNAPLAARLTVRAGRGAEDFFLTLRLDPDAWLGEVAELHLCLAEPQSPAQKAAGKPRVIWLEGETDDEGEISARWRLTGKEATPWARLKSMKRARLDLSFSQKPGI